MKTKLTYKELEKELKELRLNNKLIEQSQVVKFLWKNEDGWPVEYVSENVEQIYGYTAFDFISGNITYSSIVHDNDLLQVNNEVITNSKEGKDSFEHKPYRIINKSGETKWIYDITIIIKNDIGEITHYQGLIIDFTERNKYRIKLEEQNIKLLKVNEENKISMQRFKSFFYNNNAIMMQVSPFSKKIIKANASAIKFYGYSEQELLNKEIGDINLLSIEEIGKTMQKVIKERSGTFEFKHKTASGKIKDVETHVTAINVYGEDIFLFIIYDITKRKKTELKVIDKNKYLNNVLNSFQSGIYLSSSNYDIEFANPEMIKIIGHNPVGEKCYNAIYDKRSICSGCKKNNLLIDVGNKSLLKINYNKKNYIVNSVSLDSDTILTIFNDITLLKLTEDKLIKQNKNLLIANKKTEESEGRYKSLSNLTFEGILLHDNGVALDVNLSFAQMFGYSKDELIGKNVFILLTTEEGRKIIAKNINREYILPYEIEGIKKNGRKFPIEIEGKYTNINNKRIRVVALRDVTQRKQAQEEILKLSTAIEQSGNSVVITNVNGDIIYANPQFTKLTEYTLEEAIGKNPRILSAGVTGKEYYTELWKEITSGNVWKGDFSNISKSGKLLYESATISPVIDKNGKIINYIAIKEDITEKRKNEQKLIKSELKYKTLSNITIEGIAYHEEGVAIDVNLSFVKMFGYEVNELVGKNIINLLTVEKYREEVKIRAHSDETVPLEIEGIKKDGTVFPMLLESKTISVKNNKRTKVLSVRDISIRKKEEKRIKKLENNLLYRNIEIQEHEKSKLSKDLHDGLGPEVLSLRLYIDALENAKTKKDKDKILLKTHEILDKVTLGIRNISKSLSPYLLGDYGLDVAIDDYLKEIIVSEIEINYESKITDVRFDNKVELSIFRVLKELVNNTLKYAKSEKINFGLFVKNDTLNFMYKDNGIGFDLDILVENKGIGIGIRNIKSRIKSLNGKYKIITEENKGFRIHIEIPIN